MCEDSKSIREGIEALPRHERCRRHWYGTDVENDHECYRDDDLKYLIPRTKPTKIDVSECDGCELFVNKYMEFPLEVEDIEKDELEYRKPLGHERGALVRVRPCGDEYAGKTFLGILIASAPTDIRVSYDHERKVLKVGLGMSNPMILIPETGTIVWGYESWWSEIRSVDELQEITDDEIDSTWYVKLFKSQVERGDA